MYNPGRNSTIARFYDRRKHLVKNVRTGEMEQKQTLITKDWVEVAPMSGKQFIEQRKEESEMLYRLKMRYRKEIKVDDIVRFDGMTCDILYISRMGADAELVVKWRT